MSFKAVVLGVLLPSVLVACGGSDASTSPPADVGVDSTVDTAPPDLGVDTTPADLGVDTSVADVAMDADAGPSWPTCDAKPDAASATTIEAIWTANPSKPSFSWISGVNLTAVSLGACSAGKSCQLFFQEGAATTLAGAAHHAIRLFVSAKAASHFTDVHTGDVVDVAAYAYRDTSAGQNELILEVNDLLRGCVKKTGTGTVAPVPATLTELGDLAEYEEKVGPVLVTVSDVSGKTGSSPTTIFGLWDTLGFEAGAASIVSLSPYFLTGGAFTGLTPSAKLDFSSITGVYGLFIPSSSSDAGTPTKYLVIYPRTMSEVVLR